MTPGSLPSGTPVYLDDKISDPPRWVPAGDRFFQWGDDTPEVRRMTQFFGFGRWVVDPKCYHVAGLGFLVNREFMAELRKKGLVRG